MQKRRLNDTIKKGENVATQARGRERCMCDVGRDRKQILTLAIGGHLRHGGILHHSCRTSTSAARHYASGIGGTGETTTGPHGELLVVHHLLLLLLLGWTRTGLHLGVLTRWGAIKRLSCRIAVAIGSRVHGSRCVRGKNDKPGTGSRRSKGGLEGGAREQGDQPDWEGVVGFQVRKR